MTKHNMINTRPFVAPNLPRPLRNVICTLFLIYVLAVAPQEKMSDCELRHEPESSESINPEMPCDIPIFTLKSGFDDATEREFTELVGECEG